jgi:hypothetical protein
MDSTSFDLIDFAAAAFVVMTVAFGRVVVWMLGL